ncbi:MAG: NADH-quinone oxidoreductase subunit C [Acidaminococcaceae bacterium]|nr:NADH-quinone oxidoreductase subunit C [Acidaminococcaceae bacterium]
MQQQIIQVEASDILKRTARFKKDGCRLVQILCTRIPEGYELTYSFDKNYFLYNLRTIVPVSGSVMSVTSQYWYAFVWENEIHDLFGINVEFIAPEVDYGGHFFQLARKTPWHELANAKQPAAAVKVNLRSGLGIDASVKPAVVPKPVVPAVKPQEGDK